MSNQMRHKCKDCKAVSNEDDLDMVEGPNSYALYFACPKCGGVTERLWNEEKAIHKEG